MHGMHHETGVGQLRRDAGLVEPPRHRVARAPASIWILQCNPGLGEVSGERTREYRRVALSNEETEYAAFPQHRCHRLQRLHRVVDNLEYAVTQHSIRAGLARQPRQLGRVTLHTADEFAHTFVASPPLQRRQRIRTRVDDRHPMPFNSEGYGESTGPTTEIDDVQPSTRINPRPPCQRHPQSLTHQRGPQTPPPPIHHQPSSHSPEPPRRATPYFHPTPTTDLAAHRDQRRQPPHAGPERPAGRTTDHPSTSGPNLPTRCGTVPGRAR